MYRGGTGPGEESYLLNLETGIKTMLPHSISGVGASPNGKYYMYTNYKTNKSMIFSADQHLVNSFDPKEGFTFTARWLNNENILYYPTNPSSDLKFPSYVALLNPFSQENKSISIDYPGRLTTSHNGWIVVDPTMEIAVFPSFITPVPNMYQGQTVANGGIVWDLINRKKIIEYPNPSFTNGPFWSQDGARFIVDAVRLTIITRDGIISRLPDFGVTLDDFSWSPDRKYVALWMTEHNEPYASSFAILDTVTGELIDYCIPGVNHSELTQSAPPVWLGDGNSLVILANPLQSDDKGKAVLVDLEKGFAAVIGPFGYPSGWVDSQ
jgi:hypothetical protein